MNNDQQLVAWLGLALLLIALWSVYRSTLKAILFDSPGESTGSSFPSLSIPSLLNPFSTINSAPRRILGLSDVRPTTGAATPTAVAP